MKKIFFILIVLVVVAVIGCSQKEEEPQGTFRKVDINENKFKKVGIQENRVARVITNVGEFKILLFEDKFPQTTAHFIKLAQEGFYDNLSFHRVIKGYIIQGGSPTGDNSGELNYTIFDEYDPSIKFDRPGMVAMANKGRPNTGSCQFFITMKPEPKMNNKYPIFGEVVEGFSVVESINNAMTDMHERPVVPIVIEKILIENATKVK